MKINVPNLFALFTHPLQIWLLITDRLKPYRNCSVAILLSFQIFKFLLVHFMNLCTCVKNQMYELCKLWESINPFLPPVASDCGPRFFPPNFFYFPLWEKRCSSFSQMWSYLYPYILSWYVFGDCKWKAKELLTIVRGLVYTSCLPWGLI